MRNLKNNHIVIAVESLTNLLTVMGASFSRLLTGKEIKKNGRIWSIADHLMRRGPENLRNAPSGIALGRYFFEFIALFFSANKNDHVSQK